MVSADDSIRSITLRNSVLALTAEVFSSAGAEPFGTGFKSTTLGVIVVVVDDALISLNWLGGGSVLLLGKEPGWALVTMELFTPDRTNVSKTIKNNAAI